MSITRNKRELLARKFLNGMLSLARNAGHSLAEQVAKAVMARPEQSYEAYCHEVDMRLGADKTEVPLGRGVTMEKIQSPKHLRGAEYYANRLSNDKKTGE